MSQCTDEELAQQSLQDPERFGELIQRYQQPLWRYVMRLTNVPSETAEDIVQDTFLKAWQNLNDFDTSLKLSSWLYRICHNETIGHYRKQQSRGEDKRTDWDEGVADIVPSGQRLADEVANKITAGKLWELTQNLPQNYREVVILRFWEEKSYEEMSDILQVSVGTVGTLVARAKKQLRRYAERQHIFSSS